MVWFESEGKKMKYQVYMMDTATLFFDGESASKDDAIAHAEEAYYEKYPEDEGNLIEWSVVEIKEWIKSIWLISIRNYAVSLVISEFKATHLSRDTLNLKLRLS